MITLSKLELQKFIILSIVRDRKKKMELYSLSKLLIILDGLGYLTYVIAIENRHCRTPTPPPPGGYNL